MLIRSENSRLQLVNSYAFRDVAVYRTNEMLYNIVGYVN